MVPALICKTKQFVTDQMENIGSKLAGVVFPKFVEIFKIRFFVHEVTVQFCLFTPLNNRKSFNGFRSSTTERTPYKRVTPVQLWAELPTG